MGSTNFLPFNPAQTNQEDDTAWAADSLRSGGIAVDDILPSPFLNKVWYQANGGVYAIMAMMAAKGFTVNDTNLATLAAVLANILTTADLPAGLQSVSWASTLALNAAKYSGFQTTLAGATTITISGQTAGQVIGLLFVQDATGGRAVTYPGNIIGAAQPDPTASVLTAQLFKVDAALNLRAVSPALSINGQGGVAIGTFDAAAGNFSTLQVAGAAPAGQALVGDGAHYVPHVVAQTDKTGVYLSGVPQTNGNYPAMEQVTLTATGSGTGCEFQLEAVVNGATPMKSWVENDGRGSCFLSFLVPPGATFTVTASQLSGGSQPFSISSWLEVV